MPAWSGHKTSWGWGPPVGPRKVEKGHLVEDVATHRNQGQDDESSQQPWFDPTCLSSPFAPGRPHAACPSSPLRLLLVCVRPERILVLVSRAAQLQGGRMLGILDWLPEEDAI